MTTSFSYYFAFYYSFKGFDSLADFLFTASRSSLNLGFSGKISLWAFFYSGLTILEMIYLSWLSVAGSSILMFLSWPVSSVTLRTWMPSSICFQLIFALPWYLLESGRLWDALAALEDSFFRSYSNYSWSLLPISSSLASCESQSEDSSSKLWRWLCQAARSVLIGVWEVSFCIFIRLQGLPPSR